MKLPRDLVHEKCTVSVWKIFDHPCSKPKQDFFQFVFIILVKIIFLIYLFQVNLLIYYSRNKTNPNAPTNQFRKHDKVGLQLELKVYFKEVKLAAREVQTIAIIPASPGVLVAQNVRFFCKVLKSGQGTGVFCVITLFAASLPSARAGF